jgi:tol-pal system protein YbgF
MKKRSLTLFLMLATAPLMMQCASQDDLTLIHAQLRNLDKKINDLEVTTIEEMRKRQASNSSQIDRLNQDFMALQGSLEETGHLNRTLKEQSKELENAFKSYAQQEEEKRAIALKRLEQEIAEKDRQLEQFSSQLQTQQENLQAIQQARVEEAQRKAAAAARAAEQARMKANAVNSSASGSSVTRVRADKRKKLISGGAAPASATPSASPTTASASAPAATGATAATAAAPAAATGGSGLAQANSLFQQGKFREAYQQFEKISNSGAANADMVEARYMMGECLFEMKEYDQAILDYQNIITNHPSTAKAPKAMLRQAMAFENLNDKDTAKILYKKLIATYKDAPEAQQAQQKIDSM